MIEDRPPVSTEQNAVWWLICHSAATVDFIERNLPIDAMPLEAVIVCDIFWLTRENLRRKLVKSFREVDGASSPRRVRPRYQRVVL